MRRFAFISALTFLLYAGGLFASGTNTETFNRIRYSLPAASEVNTIEGYWNKTSTVTNVYVNYYPTGCAYTFILNCDSANTYTRSGASFIPAIVDIPLWKHHGVIGSFAFNMVDTGTGVVEWTTIDDSLYVLVKLIGVPAPTIYDTAVDSLFMSERSKGVLIQTLLDSTEGKSPAYILKNATAPGVTWTAAYHGEVDLSAETNWFERMRVYAMQAGDLNKNSETCVISLRLWLPYNTAYLQTQYYLKNQPVK